MSRIGNTPVAIPEAVSVAVAGSKVVIKGPKGELVRRIPNGLEVKVKDNQLVVTTEHHDRRSLAIHGTIRAELKNDIIGVSTGWSKKLELSGVGYRAGVSGDNLELSLGFSHPVTIMPPPGITFNIVDGKVVVSGVDKHLVGQVASNIRAEKPPEPYKGKGIKYMGEYVRKKAGKTAKGVGLAGTGAK